MDKQAIFDGVSLRIRNMPRSGWVIATAVEERDRYDQWEVERRDHLKAEPHLPFVSNVEIIACLQRYSIGFLLQSGRLAKQRQNEPPESPGSHPCRVRSHNSTLLSGSGTEEGKLRRGSSERESSKTVRFREASENS